MMIPNRKAAMSRQSGMTLVELMIAMLIGIFLMIGTVTVYTQSKSSYQSFDGEARLQENLRFALDLLEPDIRLSRFWGRHSEPALVNVPAGLVINCGGANATALATNFFQQIQAIDESIGYAAVMPCPAGPLGAGGARVDSDVLILRHASPQQTVPAPGTVQLRTDIGTSQLFTNGANPPGFGVNAQTHDLVVNIYYVANRSDLDVNTPSLRRWTLNGAGALVDEEIIAGVENLQVQFGVDENGDGSVNRYVDGNHPIITPGAPGFLPNAEIIAVRLWMVMRNYLPEPSFTDIAAYTPPDANLGVINPGDPGYPANNRRRQITKTIQLRNNRS